MGRYAHAAFNGFDNTYDMAMGTDGSVVTYKRDDSVANMDKLARRRKIGKWSSARTQTDSNNLSGYSMIWSR